MLKITIYVLEMIFTIASSAISWRGGGGVEGTFPSPPAMLAVQCAWYIGLLIDA